MNFLMLWFVKLTGFPIYKIYFRNKIYFENNDRNLKKIKGKALIISNHTSVYDYPLMVFTFFNRTVRTLIAEVMYEKGRPLARLLKLIGGIKVDRNSYDFSFITKLTKCLNIGQVGLVYPESKIPDKSYLDKKEMIDFKPSYIYAALESGAPIIPVYTNGIYGRRMRKKYHDRARLIIGSPIIVSNLYSDDISEKENIKYINDYVKNKIYSLKNQLEEAKEK